MPLAKPTYKQTLDLLAAANADPTRKSKATHVVVKVGNGMATNQDESYITVRESKKYWIDKHNTKYRKENGFEVSEWAKTHIRLDTLTSMSHSPSEHLNPLFTQ